MEHNVSIFFVAFLLWLSLLFANKNFYWQSFEDIEHTARNMILEQRKEGMINIRPVIMYFVLAVFIFLIR